jgi:hypothetical protein
MFSGRIGRVRGDPAGAVPDPDKRPSTNDTPMRISVTYTAESLKKIRPADMN